MTPSQLLDDIKRQQVQARSSKKTLRRMWKRFGATVRDRRQQKGMSLATLAKRLRLSAAMLGYLELGQRQWSNAAAERAVKIFAPHPMFPNAPVSTPDSVVL